MSIRNVDKTEMAVLIAAQLLIEGFSLDQVAGGLDHQAIVDMAEEVAKKRSSDKTLRNVKPCSSEELRRVWAEVGR